MRCLSSCRHFVDSLRGTAFSAGAFGDASALEAKGMGATDKLYGELEFNRVVTFSDMSK